MASDNREVAALGRPFTLGMLYNARTDELIPGVTLWEETTLQEMMEEKDHHSASTEIISSDSTESKSSLLDMHASLKLSFMCGMVAVGGSAKFLNDKKKSHNQSRVTFQYKVTTVFNQLRMGPLKTKMQDIDDGVRSLATHVVTGILYGGNAFFVFDSEKLEESELTEFEGSLNAAVSDIPTCDIEAEVGMKLSKEQKAVTDKFSCKYIGDFILESNPTKFEDAVKAYSTLPQLLGKGKKGKNGVPLKVWMMSLKAFDPNVSGLMSDISVGLVKQAQDTLQNLEDLGTRCNDVLSNKVMKAFPTILKNVGDFLELCKAFKSHFEQMMTKKLPSIRAGEEDEKELRQVFVDADNSLFSQKNLSEWMEDKDKEVNVIRSCMAMMEGAKVISDQSELDSEVLDHEVEDVLCFVFTSLRTSDPYLQDMNAYLQSMKEVSPQAVPPPTQDQWYLSEEVVSSMRQKAKTVHNIAKALKNVSKFRFLVAAIANEKYEGATIRHYKDNVLITHDFSKPDVAEVENITNRRDLIWYACHLTMDPATAHSSLTLSDDDKTAARGEEQSYPTDAQRFDTLTQVLCREEMTGCCYWEVELNTSQGADIAVGVCYKGIERMGKNDNSKIGSNAMSWCLGLKYVKKPLFCAEHESKSKEYPVPSTGCPRLGVFLDWPAGTLSYYIVAANVLSHIHTFQTKFCQPVYAGFKICNTKDYVTLCL